MKKRNNMSLAAPVLPHLLIINAAEGVLQLLLARIEEQPLTSGNEPASLSSGDIFLPKHLTLVFSHSWHVSGQGAELLIPALQSACELMHLPPSCITSIAAVRGPGSFTGIRLALSSAAGLARATGAVQGGIDYMWLLALQAVLQKTSFSSGQQTSQDSFAVLTHARRNLVHVQLFSTAPPGPTVSPAASSPLQALTLEDAVTFIRTAAPTSFLLGSGLTRNRAVLQEQLQTAAPNAILLPPHFDTPGTDTLLQAASLIPFCQKDLQPLYARESEAEENFDDIARKLHLDPKKARATLERLTRD